MRPLTANDAWARLDALTDYQRRELLDDLCLTASMTACVLEARAEALAQLAEAWKLTPTFYEQAISEKLTPGIG